MDSEGRTKYEVERALDIAIGEYAPGRTLVVDKKLYQIGGLYYRGSERWSGQASSPARKFVEDRNYLKQILSCHNCGWFGFTDDRIDACPFCGNSLEKSDASTTILRPWGFAPKNAEPVLDAQVDDLYSYAQPPLYSTLPESDEMEEVSGCKNIRMAQRRNQNIIMINPGPMNRGFMVCKDCGAAMPGDTPEVLKNVLRPYKSRYAKGKCRHNSAINVSLGYDFVTDMLVLEFALDDKQIDAQSRSGLWLSRAASSLAEAIRLVICKKLDIEFTELVTGWRFRKNSKGSYVDIYLYDSLSSGAGYAISAAGDIGHILEETKALLNDCDCESACHKCLKHYRNQHVHGQLDRFAAAELLDWGQDGNVVASLDIEEQKRKVDPFLHILEMSGIEVSFEREKIIVREDNRSKELSVYPSMWKEPRKRNCIYISEAFLKYAKPYAVQKIVENI